MRRSRRDRQKLTAKRAPQPVSGVGEAGVAGRSAGPRRLTHKLTPGFEMTVGAFLARQRSGALLQGPRAELVDGKVVAGASLDPSEAAALVHLSTAFAQAGLADRGVEVLSWAPLRLGPVDLVRSAVVLLPGPAYFDERPAEARWVARARDAGAGMGGSFDPAAALLLVEAVRAGGRHYERLARFAAAGARAVWLLDVRRGWVESFRSPWRREYRSRTLWYPGELVPVPTLPDVAVEALVPP